MAAPSREEDVLYHELEVRIGILRKFSASETSRRRTLADLASKGQQVETHALPMPQAELGLENKLASMINLERTLKILFCSSLDSERGGGGR
jgi:hypothetical protein